MLNASTLAARLDSLRRPIFGKVKEIREMETGYDLVFTEPLEFSNELLEMVNFERQCCASFAWALVFDPFNVATHLQVYGSDKVKQEIRNALENYGLDKLISAQ